MAGETFLFSGFVHLSIFSLAILRDVIEPATSDKRELSLLLCPKSSDIASAISF